MKPIRTIVAFVFMTVFLTGAIAQKNDSTLKYKKSYYANFDLGRAGIRVASSLGFVAQVGNKSVLGLSFQGTVKSIPFGGFITVPEIESVARSLYYGKIFKLNWGHFLLMGGPSHVKVTEYTYFFSRSPVSEKQQGSAGLALQASLVRAYRFMGLGVHLFANINSAHTYAGITVGIALGKVNYKHS